MIKAKDFVGGFANIYAIPYKGEILYNILLEEHSKMIINNLIVETMDPKIDWLKYIILFILIN